MNDIIKLQIRLDSSLHEGIKEAAEEHRNSINSEVLQAIRHHILLRQQSDYRKGFEDGARYVLQAISEGMTAEQALKGLLDKMEIKYERTKDS